MHLHTHTCCTYTHARAQRKHTPTRTHTHACTHITTQTSTYVDGKISSLCINFKSNILNAIDDL